MEAADRSPNVACIVNISHRFLHDILKFPSTLAMPQDSWNENRDKLAGAWKTISFEVFDGTGPDKKLVAKPHGDNPLGRVVITRDGFLSAHMAYPDRIGQPLPSGKAWQVGDDAEVAHVARGLSMYCGHLQLFEDDEGLYWKTKAVISSDPNRQGVIEERRVQVFDEGGKTFMILQPKNDMVMHVSFPPALRGRRLTGSSGWDEDQRSAQMGEVRIAMACL